MSCQENQLAPSFFHWNLLSCETSSDQSLNAKPKRPPNSFWKPDLDSWSGIDFLSTASKKGRSGRGHKHFAAFVVALYVCVCVFVHVYWYLRVCVCLCVCFGFLHLHMSLQICPFLKCEKTHNVLFTRPSLSFSPLFWLEPRCPQHCPLFLSLPFRLAPGFLPPSPVPCLLLLLRYTLAKDIIF